MRYFIGILIAVVVVLGVGAWIVWRYEGQLGEAHAEAEQLKRDRDMAKASLADTTRNQADFLGKAREGEVWPRPGMAPVPELKELANSLGFQSIHVYRWHGGTLDGWVQFQTEAEPVKRDFLEYAKHAKAMGGENFDPRAVSGVIAIAFKARKDEPDISDCIVAISQTVESVGKAEKLEGKEASGDRWHATITTKGGSTTTLTFSGAIDARKAGIRSPPGSATSWDNKFSGDKFALWFGTGEIDESKKFQVFELKLSPERGK